MDKKYFKEIYSISFIFLAKYVINKMLTCSLLIPKNPELDPYVKIDKKENDLKTGERDEWKYNVPLLVRKLCQKLIDDIFFSITWLI